MLPWLQVRVASLVRTWLILVPLAFAFSRARACDAALALGSCRIPCSLLCPWLRNGYWYRVNPLSRLRCVVVVTQSEDLSGGVQQDRSLGSLALTLSRACACELRPGCVPCLSILSPSLLRAWSGGTSRVSFPRLERGTKAGCT